MKETWQNFALRYFSSARARQRAFIVWSFYLKWYCAYLHWCRVDERITVYWHGWAIERADMRRVEKWYRTSEHNWLCAHGLGSRGNLCAPQAQISPQGSREAVHRTSYPTTTWWLPTTLICAFRTLHCSSNSNDGWQKPMYYRLNESFGYEACVRMLAKHSGSRGWESYSDGICRAL